MVKFYKQFEAQMIAEWRDAYMDYRQLKKDLKKTRTENCNNNSSTMEEGNTSSPTIISSSLKKIFQIGQKHRHHGPIQVHMKLASSTRDEDTYKTELLEQFADAEAAREFFGLLDLQLNKVNLFYKAKEKEFLEWRESLRKQLEILIELKTALNEKRQKGDQANESSRGDPSISCHISYETEEEQEDASNTDELYCDNKRFTESSRGDAMERSIIRRDESGSNRMLGRVFHSQGRDIRLNIPLSTPSHTFTAIGYLVWEGIVNPSSNRNKKGEIRFHVNKTNLQEAENMIRGSFIELYKGLHYLKSYRSLNMLGMVRILKKFDKVTSKEVMPIYLRVVESSYFNISDKVTRLAHEVKALFVKQFGEDDHKKAMMYLKPAQGKESHGITFFIGLFTGCFLALLAGYVIMAHIIGMYKQRSGTTYMETVYPVLSMFSLLFLHLFLYGCNILMWKKAHINYSFIFELTPTKELKYKDVFLICTASMTAVVGVLFLHLTLVAKGYASTKVQTIPGFLLLFFLLLLVCPFNIVYKASRCRFLRVIRNIVFSPLYKVDMLDFYMADQLCSQVPLLRNLEYIACYYISGSYRTQDYNYCTKNTLFRDLAYAVSFLPYYWRAMQCARRWLDEGQTNHLVNLGKYVSAMLAAGAKVAYEKDKSVLYLCLVVALSSVATVYQLYWDYVQDWKLLRLNSQNLWLRDELMVKRKSVYYFSMVLNLVLRLAWIQTVLHTTFGSLDYRVMGLLLAALEVIRRGQWNFYRLENEQLSNAGKFRAVKTVPLPFSEVGEEN